MIAFKWVLQIGLCCFVAGCHSNGSSNSSAAESVVKPEANDGPPFKKQGDLYFLSKINNDTLQHIDVEFATTDEERQNGLMHRKSMLDTQGMLFIFPKAMEQSFWMRNTYISLDIIYIDSEKEIVSVQKYTTPLSEESLPSFKPAQYVVEVNAGFCDKYHIAYGDKINYKSLK